MPATTPNGYPYAEPTDPLVQWPATAQSLAEKIDTEVAALPKVWAGYAVITGHGPVSFPPGLFTSPPFVVATLAEAPGLDMTGLGVVILPGITVDSVEIGVKRAGAWEVDARGVQIVAVQP